MRRVMNSDTARNSERVCAVIDATCVDQGRTFDVQLFSLAVPLPVGLLELVLLLGTVELDAPKDARRCRYNGDISVKLVDGFCGQISL